MFHAERGPSGRIISIRLNIELEAFLRLRPSRGVSFTSESHRLAA